MPPISCTSLAVKRPPGRRSAISGVRSNTSATSSMSKAMPASCAIAGICSAALVEPPVAATIAQAFSSAFRVTMSRGSGPPRSIAAHHDCAGAAGVGRALGIDPGNHRHVWHAQAERLRHHRHRVGGELPGAGADTRQAGALEPGKRRLVHRAGHHRTDRLVGIEDRHVAAVKAAGQRRAAIDEDRGHVAADHAHHHARQRLVAAAEADQPVIGKARARPPRSSSAISSRDTSENFIPSWFMLIPSDTEIVVNSRGVPPASATPFLGRIDLEAVRHVARRLLALHADDADHRLARSPHRRAPSPA